MSASELKFDRDRGSVLARHFTWDICMALLVIAGSHLGLHRGVAFCDIAGKVTHFFL